MRYLRYILNKLLGNFRYKYNSLWDKKLNEILSDFEIIDTENEECVTLKHNDNLYMIYIGFSNCRYYSLERVNFRDVGRDFRFRPSIKTMIKLDKLVLEPSVRKRKEQQLQKLKDTYK